MLSKNLFKSIPLVVVMASCQSNQADISDIKDVVVKTDTVAKKDSVEVFQYQTEQFSDLRILRYQVPGFNELSLQQKTLLYYLSEAALCGRDMMWDQHYKYNLTVRKTLENIVDTYKGDRKAPEFAKFMEYTKRVWFSNGIHHHYSSDKIMPEFTKEYFASLVGQSVNNGFPYNGNENELQFIDRLSSIIFDPKVAPKRVNLDSNVDMVKNSAINFYEGVSQKEASDFYKDANKTNLKTPVMTGLNTKLVKENGKIVEKTWKLGSMYTQAIEKIIFWLEKASTVAENPAQKDAIDKLIIFYKSGSLVDFDTYSIAWAKDTESAIDAVNGFIEVYNDPIGYKGSFESVVSVKDMEASKRIKTIGDNAQWFEDNSPIQPNHKKKEVKGIAAKVINVVMESGDAAPSTPIGVNLPNNEWIREQHGSKSVNLGNIVEAYDMAAGAGVVGEFYINKEIQDRVKNFAPLADKLHTDMHEVIGHASGQIEPGIDQPATTLKNYASTLEEARADLVALYYLYDQKLVDLGVIPSLDYGKASYDEYITKGLMVQLSRLKLGDNIEEAHMRNRQLVAAWVFEKGQKENVISKVKQNEKTYFVVNDYTKLKVLFGELLKEIQRIKSQGDYKAGKNLVENYGVKVDKAMHKEVLDRYAKLNFAPYAGFIQPKLVPVMEGNKIKDVKIEYPKDFTEQMMYYGKNYGLLPVVN
ncbi:MAG: dihydrofolate reductase [Bacteroidota bacterium]|nr:dihydrofolate reductase [Bacteroidota bacterium]